MTVVWATVKSASVWENRHWADKPSPFTNLVPVDTPIEPTAVARAPINCVLNFSISIVISLARA